MTVRSRLLRFLRPLLADAERTKAVLRRVDDYFAALHHRAAARVPALIRPSPASLSLAITAACNNRCRGCAYGRDFMPGRAIALDVARQVLDDARAAGVGRVRIYGGEPLLHRELPQIVAHAIDSGFDTYVTTNATLLDRRIDELHAAGLRSISVGFYGVGDDYDDYVQRSGHYAAMRRGIAAARERYGDAFHLQLNFVLTRRSGNRRALAAAWAFAQEFACTMTVDPFNEPVPFFVNPERSLSFRAEDAAELRAVAAELERLQRAHPSQLRQPVEFLRALPDLLLPGGPPPIPCDAYQMIWVGPDGTVQLCDTHFVLGNVNQTRLRDILFTAAHRQACRDGFALACPACTCKIDSRIKKHAASLRRYGSPLE